MVEASGERRGRGKRMWEMRSGMRSEPEEEAVARKSRERVREVRRWRRRGEEVGKAPEMRMWQPQLGQEGGRMRGGGRRTEETRSGMRSEPEEREGEGRERQREEEAVAGRSRERVREVRRWRRCGEGVGKAPDVRRWQPQLGQEGGERRGGGRTEKMRSGMRSEPEESQGEGRERQREEEEEEEEEEAVAGRSRERVREVRTWRRCGEGVGKASEMRRWQSQLGQEGGGGEEGEKMEGRVVERRRTKLLSHEEG